MCLDQLRLLACRFIPVRSPGKRLAEVLVLVLATGTVWFLASYASPCHTLPRPVSRGASGPRPSPYLFSATCMKI